MQLDQDSKGVDKREVAPLLVQFMSGPAMSLICIFSTPLSAYGI